MQAWKTPEQSDHASVKRRCEKACKTKKPNQVNQQDASLFPFVGNPREYHPDTNLVVSLSAVQNIPYVLCTGRVLRKDKRGAISASVDKILTRLEVDEDQWLEMTSNFETCFSSFVGGESSLRMACENLHYQRPPGLATCKRMFHR